MLVRDLQKSNQMVDGRNEMSPLASETRQGREEKIYIERTLIYTHFPTR
jgi:hypothetical protein